MALAAYKHDARWLHTNMMFAFSVDFRLSLDFFDSCLYTRTAVARLTLALAKLSCKTVVSVRYRGDRSWETRHSDMLKITITTTRSAGQSPTWGHQVPQVRVESQFRYSNYSSRSNGSWQITNNSKNCIVFYRRTTWHMDLRQLTVYIRALQVGQYERYNVFVCGPKFITRLVVRIPH